MPFLTLIFNITLKTKKKGIKENRIAENLNSIKKPETKAETTPNFSKNQTKESKLHSAN